MSRQSWVERNPGDPHIALRCDCGWSGADAEVTSWDVQAERDRVVRRCPNCERAVPEWGTFRPIDGVRAIAHGSLADALDET